MYRFLFFQIFLFFAFLALSQPSRIERLITEADSVMEENLVSARNLLINSNFLLSEQVSPSITGQYYFTLAKTYYFEQILDSALIYFNTSLDFFDSMSVYRAESLFNIGRCYFYKSNHVSALTHFLQAIKVYEKLEDQVGQAKTSNAVGIVSSIMGQEDQALAYMNKALKLNEIVNDSVGIAGTLDNIGNVYARIGDLNTSLQYGLKSLKIKELIGDKRALAISYENLGDTYQELGDFEKSFIFYQKSLDLVRKEESDYYLSFTFLNMSKIGLAQRNYNMAQAYADSGLLVALKHNQIENIHFAYDILHEIALNRGKFDLSLEFYKKSITFKDSLFGLDKQRILEELKTEYETEQKEQRILQLEQERAINQLQADQERQLRFIIVLIAILLLLTAGFIFYRYKVKEKNSRILDQKNTELQALNLTKDRLFAIISHDLKSPLSAFQTITEQLTANWDRLEKDQLRSFIESLRDSSREVHAMMDNLLRWALSQTDQLNYKPEIINPRSIVELVKKQLNSALQTSGISIVDQGDDSVNVLADKDFLQIVIRNLLSNAIKYSAENTTVSIRSIQENGEVRIAISDQGTGMSEADISKILEKDTLGVHEITNVTNKGTGLGLQLCKDLMAKMNGWLEISSIPGKGSIFTLVFKEK